jgi:DNA-binding beta-propeller fold protein YncE
MRPLVSLLLSRIPSASPGRTGARTSRRRFAPRRLELEMLEDRSVPTAVALPSNAVSWWTANSTANDALGLNNATLSNVTYSTGEVGKAFSFNGLNGWAALGDPSSLAFTASMTIEGWIKLNGLPTNYNFGSIMFRGDDRGGLDPYQLVILPNGDLQFLITGAPGSPTQGSPAVEAPIPMGQFVHVAATLDDTTGAMALYENGTVVAQTTTTARPFGPLDPTQEPGVGIGNSNALDNYDVPFNGLIDELTVYTRALTAGEVLGIYKAGSSGKIISPISLDDPSVVDGSGGATTQVTFTITRTGSLSGSLTVNWTTADDTAIAGTDYVAGSGSVTFADGQATQTVQVVTIDSNVSKPNLDFKLIGTPAGGTSVMGLATILNDDAAISIGNDSATEGTTAIRSLGALVPSQGSVLSNARGITFGPDGNVYVTSELPGRVNRYDRATGRFLGAFASSPSPEGAKDLAFGPDGNLYVTTDVSNDVLRFNGATGAFMDDFVTPGSGGLTTARGLTFGPDGNLYVISAATNSVLRYNGVTGAFMDAFVPGGSGGLVDPSTLVFGPDGNLYVASGTHTVYNNSILRYNGTTGAFIDIFVPSGSGGLTLAPTGGVVFGPDMTQDGTPDLYVSNGDGNNVLIYDGHSGAFVKTYVASGLGGLSDPKGLLFDTNGNLFVVSNGNNSVLRFGAASQFAFTVSLASVTAGTTTVDYSTADGTAVAGRDYVATPGTLTFAPGETVKTILVPTLDDGGAEPTKGLTVNLSNPTGGIITSSRGIGTILDDTKFYVVDSGASHSTYQYASSGAALGNNAPGSGDAAPRGVATTAAGTTDWVVDANKTVYVYSTGGSLLGSWSAGGLSSSATLTGIATNGTDIWLVDSYNDKVYDYAGAASRLSGSQNAAGSFSLVNKHGNSNTNPQDIVTDGTSFWVVDGSALKVFKYTLSGSFLGSWAIDPADTHPTGITINPNNVSDIWIVDNGTLKVYDYAGAASRTSGSQSAGASFSLASGDTNPQGIADPPPADMLVTPAAAPVNAAPSVGPLTLPAAPSLTGRDAVFALLTLHSPTLAGDSLGTRASTPAALSASAPVTSFAPASSPAFRSDDGSVGLPVGTSADDESLVTAADAFFASRADDAMPEE